jgi:hypothetical protein
MGADIMSELQKILIECTIATSVGRTVLIYLLEI